MTKVVGEAAAVIGERFRWPNGVVPFTIDPNLPNPDRVNGPNGAINYYHNNTPIRFVTHTNEANLVIFKKGTDQACAAQVGMQDLFSPIYFSW